MTRVFLGCLDDTAGNQVSRKLLVHVQIRPGEHFGESHVEGFMKQIEVFRIEGRPVGRDGLAMFDIWDALARECEREPPRLKLEPAIGIPSTAVDASPYRAYASREHCKTALQQLCAS